MRFIVLSIAVLLVLSFTSHTFVEHGHYGDYHEEHGAEHNKESATFIKAFFHGDNRKMLWVFLSYILAIFAAGIFFEKNHKYLPILDRVSEFKYFIIPFREALRRGIINPKLYS